LATLGTAVEPMIIGQPMQIGNAIPDFSSQITFSGSTRPTPFNDLDDLSVDGIQFNMGADDFILSGNAITLTGDIVTGPGRAERLIVQTINMDMIVNANRSIITKGGAADTTGNGLSFVINGDISGTGGLSIGSAQSDENAHVTLAGNNTFAGELIFEQRGRLYVSSDANLGAGAAVRFTGVNSFLYVTDSFATDKTIDVQTNNTRIDVATDKTLTLNGIYSVAAGVEARKVGGGKRLC
jgi:hypothetical protein